ncbi:hypothetical protein BK706_07585 [Bacillus thuringiensis serovar leesis]|nr:hypothetical protein BK706_07585 [Bacillus thuringiensis serovar leesis]
MYNENKQAYKITSSENAQLHLTWEYTKGNNATVYSGDGDEKYWKIERTTDGYYILRNYKDPTKVLDLGEDGAQNGANVQVFGQNGSKFQKWKVELADPRPLKDGEYQIKSSFNQNLVVDLSNNSDGANVQGYQNLIRKNQQWKFVYNANKQAYKITSSQNAQLHLTWEYTKGNNATVYSGDGDEKYWKFERTTDGYYILRNYKDPTKVLDLGEGGAQNGANVQVFGQNGSKFQKWKVEQTNQPIIPNGTYTISTKLNYKKMIDHNPSTNKAVLFEFMNNPSAEWKFEYDFSKQAYQIRTVKYQNLGLYYQGKNFALSVNNVDNNNSNDLRSYWKIEYNNQKGGFLFRSVQDPDQVIDLKNSSTLNSAEIQTSTPKFDTNQLWNIVNSSK